ncbi:MAG: leucyl aminopeptidase [Synergistaceae bacterium]|jgi:leucyl aminopeptidase|nr:leucyl aminopeptidase [Synergistaceae bacterium]
MTDIAALSGSVEHWKGDALLVLAGEEDCEKCDVPSPYGEYVRALAQRGDFEGKKGSLVRVPLFEGGVKNLYAAGLGKAGECTPAALRDALTAALRKIGRERNRSVLALIGAAGPETDVILGEAVGLCGYVFDKYKKKEKEDSFVLERVFAKGINAEKTSLGLAFADAQCFARDLSNEPGNVINPLTLADAAARLAKESGLTCEVWDEERLERERMGALLAVGRGSRTPPRLIHLAYVPEEAPKGAPRKKAVLVGKGLTFDSGGLDLKTPDFMKTMKGDKSAACGVLGVLKGVAALKPRTEVHGIVPAAENMPDGGAFRPDDIIRARNGKTIEVDNTDAEGRLVLADALSLASGMKPDVLIEMSTLTGACAVALGNWTAGLFTKDEGLCQALLDAAGRRGERLWRLPMDDERIGETLKSKFADLVNGASRYGGAVFAAMFLNEFVEKGVSWAHIDIAGADFMKEESGVYTQGASAWGVRTCLDYVLSL